MEETATTDSVGSLKNWDQSHTMKETCIDDIEDIVTSTNGADLTVRPAKTNIHPKSKRKVTDKHEHVEANVQSYVPGVHKIYVKTWGCSHNSSDSEYMAGQLAAYGYPVIDDPYEADLWLLNSCTVKTPAEDHFRNDITKARELGKYIVLAGCVPQGQPKAEYIKGLSVVGVQQIDRVVEVVEETLKGNSVRLFSQKKVCGKKQGGTSLQLPKIRRNPLIEIIAINTGCLNQCTYCKTKHARGDVGSYSPTEIVNRAMQSFDEGVVEIWLTSEDLGAYGKDIGVRLPDLLWRLSDIIPDGCMMRLGMTNPPYILEYLEDIAAILRLPRVYSFLHVPVQSASDSVLMDMKREYCADDFRLVVDFLKKEVRGVTIATDVICGFPTETDEDFQETLSLVDHYKFPSLFINQFFPRPGTPAAKMPRIPAQETKKRTKTLSELFQSYQPYDHKVGERQTVLVTEVSHDHHYYVAHNKFYEQVLVPKNEQLMGKMVTVDIISTGKHYLMGRLVPESQPIRPNVPAPFVKGQVSGCLIHPQDSKVSSPKNVVLLLGGLTLVSAILIRLVPLLSKSFLLTTDE